MFSRVQKGNSFSKMAVYFVSSPKQFIINILNSIGQLGLFFKNKQTNDIYNY